MGEISTFEIQHNYRYVPRVLDLKIRTTIGFILLVLSTILAGVISHKGHLGIIIIITTISWILTLLITDKYVHKYPQRYYTYLIASHLKSSIIMAICLLIFGKIIGSFLAPFEVLFISFIFFVFADILVSAMRQKDISKQQFFSVNTPINVDNVTNYRFSNCSFTNPDLSSINTQIVIRDVRFYDLGLSKALVDFIEKYLPEHTGNSKCVLAVDDIPFTEDQSKISPVGLLVGRVRINEVRRLNNFLLYCVEHMILGGYLVLRYRPLDMVVKSLRERYPGMLYWPVFILHFMWYRAFMKTPWLDKLYFSPIFSWVDAIYLSFAKKRNRVLSKAEVWGRLAFCGIEVVAELRGNDEAYLLARRVALPVKTKRTSYYPIVSLEKVGLDGEVINTHKIRTMFPFSEFIQKRLYEDHGLTSTGKFADDFRLTEIGKFLRKYWLDELPQIYDWLRGDIKLVGMRATSRHFLGLYPKELYDLYVQIKPGLIPPIFDESTTGFDKIVEVELKYLKSYWEQPIRTDIRYLFKTFTDIIFRGVRSK